MLADIILKVAKEEGFLGVGEQPYRPRPSLAGPERCIRQMVYYAMGFPKAPLPGRAIMIFSDSSFHEDLTADWIRKSAYKFHSDQMKVNLPDPLSTGSIDGIITDTIVTGFDYLYEHKGISHFSFQNYWNGNELPLDYFSQVALYSWGLMREIDTLNGFCLLMKNKNTAQYMEYLGKYDKEKDVLSVNEKVHSGQPEKIELNIELKDIIKNCVDKFNKVENYVECKTLPKRQYDMDHWRCQYCGWYETCYENYREELESMEDNFPLPAEISWKLDDKKEVGKIRLSKEKEEKKLQAEIKKYMKQNDLKHCYGQNYQAELKLFKRGDSEYERLMIKKV